MATELVIPKLGMSMKDAKIVEWKAQEGEWINEKQVVLVIETAKVTYEIESLAAGFLHILAAPGAVLRVAEAAALVAETEEELAKLQAEQPTAVAPAEGKAVAAAAEAAPAAPPERRGRVKISPAAKKMAEAHQLDIGTIPGTGPGGRIVKEDIERALQAREAEPAAPAAADAGEVIDGKRVRSTIPLAGMRQAIAEHMQQSLAMSAQLTTMGEVDMTELIKLRSGLLEKEAVIGARITYTDLFVLTIARALKSHPIINSSLIGDEIKIWDDINVGVAVALEEGVAGGLIVPVVRNADRKSLGEISLEIKGLVEKARTGKLMPDDVGGGTFTLTNLGAFGGGYGFGTPIINQPQAAIFGTGATSDRPVVREGQVVVRPVMTYSFTFDHRVIDGAPAGKFVATLVELLETPILLLA